MDPFASMEIAKGKWARMTSGCWTLREQYHVYSQRWLWVPVLSQLLCAAANLWFIFFQAQSGPNSSSDCQISSFSFLSSWSSWASNTGLEGIGLSPKCSEHDDDNKNRVDPTYHYTPHFIAIFLFQMPFLPTPSLILQAKAAFNIMLGKYPNCPWSTSIINSIFYILRCVSASLIHECLQ